MERPFDHPGMSEPDGFDPHQLKRAWTNPLHHEYDDCGGHIVKVSLWFAPNWWSREEIQQALDYLIEPERCHHSYDCCAQFYGGRARVIDVTENVRDDDGNRSHLAIVRRDYVQNV